MRKKILIIILTITHMLCFLLGFFINTLNTTQNEKKEPTEETKAISNEKVTEAKENYSEVTEEHIEEVIITEDNLATSEEIVPEKPTENTPNYTDPPTTQPFIPQQQATKPPENEPEDEFGGGRV